MFQKIKRKLTQLFFTLLSLAFLALMVPRLVTALHARSRMVSVKDSPSRPAAVVFGAGLTRAGAPTPVLRDRVDAATALYFAGKVEKILMSGDNRFIYHNEPQAMKEYAIEQGVPASAIVLDYAGRSTYDTCYRAGNIFGLKEVLLVTQGFHLPRALYICRQLGLDAVGVIADQRVYRARSMLYWSLRELPATLAAFWDVHLARPLPVLGDKEPIFPLSGS